MKTTATALLMAFGLLALCALAEIIGNLLAPLGAIPALVFFGALFTALIKTTK